jgi:hypothetical protein
MFEARRYAETEASNDAGAGAGAEDGGLEGWNARI